MRSIVLMLTLFGCSMLSFATFTDHRHKHPANFKDKLKHAFKKRNKFNKRYEIVKEDQILLEEIMASAQGMENLFDSHVPSNSTIPNSEKIAPKEPVQRHKRQVDQQTIRDALCKDKNPGEFFRLVGGATHCRDVVACADHGLQALRCPPGLVFDLGKQTCEWKQQVRDCDIKVNPKLALPQYNTLEPICLRGELACGDGQCLPRSLFCDDKTDCADGSDENLCDVKNDPNRAEECSIDLCRLPECFCSVSGKEIPGGLPAEEVPQMIMITFDDALNINNYDIYNQIFSGRLKNPNGCDVKATLFVSHRYTNYSMVQEMHSLGHEIAVHSITHDNEEEYWDKGTEDVWRAEMGGAREIMEKWGNIPAQDVRGSRAPLLRLGGNRQFAALEKEGFVYDSTMVAQLSNPPYWPYPMAFSAPHRCQGNFQVCPTRSHSLMEMVMNEFDPREEPGHVDELVLGCAMLDSCSYIRTADNLYNILTHNFIRHYEQNRAPMGLYLHAAWLKKSPEMLDALQFWLEEVLATYNDVYIVTMSQVLAWMQSPVDRREALAFPAWKENCLRQDTENNCHVSNNCHVFSPALGGVKQRLQTCNTCPQYYPWLGDVNGKGIVSK